MSVKRFLSQLCILFLVFDPAIPPIKIFGGAPFSIFISTLYIFFYGKSITFNRVLSMFRFFIAFSIIIVFYVTARIIIDLAEEPSYFFTIVRTCITMFATILYIAAFVDEYTNKDLLVVFLMNGLYALLASYNESLLNLALFLKAGDYSLDEFSYNLFRVSFLSGNSAFGIASIYCMLIVYLMSWNALYSKLYASNMMFMMFMMALCFFGFMSGRVTILSVVLSFFILLLHQRKSLFITVCVLAISFPLVIHNLNFDNPTVRWALENYIEYVNSGKVDSNSTIQLREMYAIPENADIIVGDGHYRALNGSYYGGTDVGYIRHILFGGLLYCAILYLYPLSLFLMLRSRCMVIYMLAMLFILEAKGNVIFDSSPITSLVMIFSAISIQFENKQRCSEKKNHAHSYSY